MRIWFVGILLQVLALQGMAETLALRQFGVPFSATNVDVVWRASSNDLPSTLWTYRVLRARFPRAVISKLTALGSFTAKDGKPVPHYPHVLSLGTSDGKRSLLVNPDCGYFEYHDYDADNMHIVEGVPDEDQSFALATNLLPKLGVDLSTLAVKPHSAELRTLRTDERAVLAKGLGMPAYATNVPMRGVYFIRSLDGVDFAGTGARGGCTVEFGHDAKVSRLIVSWRTLKRDRRYQVAKPELVMNWIRTGNAFWLPSRDTPNIDWASAKKLQVTKATPLYFGEPYIDTQEKVYPFVALEATVDSDGTNSVVRIDCPILEGSDGNPLP